MGEPRTGREVLIAEMLGELDELLRRAEQLPKAIADAEMRVAITVRLLDDAGDRYRLVVTQFTEEAKKTLTDHLQYKTQQSAAFSLDQRRVAVEEAARAVFNAEALRHAARVKAWQDEHAARSKCRSGGVLLEHSLVAVLASTLTAVLVLLIEKLS